MSRLFPWLCLWALVCVTSCSKNQSDTLPPTPQSEEDSLSYLRFDGVDVSGDFLNRKTNTEETERQKQFLENFFENYWTYNQVSGGLLVAKNGKVLYENYRGYSKIETGDTLDANTPIHLASISKTLTAAVILKLVEEKKFKLKDKVKDILPSFVYEDIRVLDLLNHRSGLPNYNYFPHDVTFWDTNIVQNNQSMLLALNEKLVPPYNPPNQNFSYCNTNYAVLALIIEKVTGMRYPEAMKYMLFDPLQMTNTFVFKIEDSARVSQSYSHRNTRWKFNYLDNIYGDKNIYSTPRDLLKFDIALYADQFLTKDLKKKMMQGYSYENKGVKNYGLGFRIMEYENGETIWHHNGWWHGNYTTYVHGKNDTVAIIALGNKQIRSVYSAFSLIGLFGDYFVYPDDTMGLETKDSLQLSEDSLMQELKKEVEKNYQKKRQQHKKLDSNSIKTKKKIKPTIDSIPLQKKVKPKLPDSIDLSIIK